MRITLVAWMVAAGALLLAAPVAQAQYLHGVGGGPSTQFTQDLPSNNINRTLGDTLGFSTADRFTRRGGGEGSSYLSVGRQINLMRSTYAPTTMADLAVGPGIGPLMHMKFRTIASLNFEKRARFAKLRETTLALAERIRQVDEASLAKVSLSFRQFMFPFPIQDQPAQGYGFFSRTDLVGGATIDPDAFLAPFTQEVQQSLGDARFLDATQALLLGRPLPQGVTLEQFYDTQLAALANSLFNNGKYESAANLWAILAGRDPANATAARALGICLLASRQTKKAAPQLRQSFVLARGWPDGLRITGSNLQDVFPSPQELASIRDELNAQLAKAPDDADLNFLMAFTDLFHGNWTAAEERLTKLAPADEVARGLLGRIKAGAVSPTVRRPAQASVRTLADELTGLEEPTMSPEARERLIAILESGPATFEDYLRLGDFRFFMGEYTRAGEAYRAAHKAKPEDPFAMFAMVHGAFANGEYRQAGRYLQSALALEPNWGLYEFHLQEFYGERKEFDDQVRGLERAIELRPRAADLRFLLAYIYYFSGRYADATDALVEVLRLDPAFQQANNFLRLARLQG